MDPGTEHHADAIDAAVFSSDIFSDPNARTRLRELMASWERELASWDRVDLANAAPSDPALPEPHPTDFPI